MRYSNSESTSRSVNEDTPRYYEWRVPGHPLSVQLSLAVVERLETDIMKGFWAVPKRGMEVGGVLLGRIESGDETSVFIDDYEAVSCEHRRGPSYVLSEPDRKRLEKVLKRANGGKQVVGLYRSHTRLGLYLDQDDMAVIDSYFGNPNQVFLLVRPDATKPGAAGFFFREESELHRQSTYLEFPFSSAEIRKQMAAPEPGEAQAPPVAAVPPVVVPPPPVMDPVPVADTPPAATLPLASDPPPEPERPVPVPRFALAAPPRLRQFKWKLAAGIAAGIVAFGALEYQVFDHFRRPAAVQANFAPSLSVEPSGGYLQVYWNRNAPAVLKAERGVLSITDGGFQKELNLDESQLRTGAVVYAPRGNEVNFRLDLLDGRTTVSESLRFVSGTPIVPAAQASAVQTAAVTREKTDTVEAKAKARRRVFFDDGL